MKKIDELVSKNMNNLVHNLQEIARIKSVQGKPEPKAPFGSGPKEALDYGLSLCNSLGFKTKNVDNYVGWAEIGEGEEIIGIPVHLDVVPEGLGFVPDASYPICNGEKGRLHLKFKKETTLEEKKVYITMNGGEEVNSVPDKCQIIIYNLESLKYENFDENVKITEIGGNTIIDIEELQLMVAHLSKR